MRIYRVVDSGNAISFATRDSEGVYYKLQGDLYDGLSVTQQILPSTRLLTPLIPTAIWCIGLNYRLHAQETGARLPEFPVLFMKGLNTCLDPYAPIEIPSHLRSTEVDYEGELAVVIGKKCKNVAPEQALKYVAGYTCANDVSARDWQKKWSGSQWCRGKSFDTFCPLGPCLVTPDELTNPNNLNLRTLVNGEVLQESNTSDMIFDISTLISFLSGSTTLLPGTVILTGTPSGVGLARSPQRWLNPSDTVTVEIELIGSLTNPVIQESL